MSLLQVTLTVDGLYNERWMTSGSFSVLASSTVFLGGSEATFSLPGTKTNNNLVGCLKKVGGSHLLVWEASQLWRSSGCLDLKESEDHQEKERILSKAPVWCKSTDVGSNHERDMSCHISLRLCRGIRCGWVKCRQKINPSRAICEQIADMSVVVWKNRERNDTSHAQSLFSHIFTRARQKWKRERLKDLNNGLWHRWSSRM